MQALDLLLGDLDLLERRRDLLEGQVAALATRSRSGREGPRSRAASPRPPRAALPRSPPDVPVLHEKHVRLLSQSPVLSCASAARKYMPCCREPGAVPLGNGDDRIQTLPGPDARRPGRPPGDRGQPHPGRGRGRREGDPRRRRSRHDGDGAVASSTSPSSSASSTSTRSRPAFTCRASRRSSTRRSTTVVLGETLRAEELARTDRRAGARAPGRACAPRSRIAARYPETVPTPVSGLRHPGDLHPVRDRGRLRARDPDPDRRRGAGDDRVSVRPGAARRQRARAPGRRRLHRGRDRARLRRRPRRHPQPARDRLAAHRPSRGRRGRDRRTRPAPHRRSLDELGDL